jgi:hypothetical protein
MIRIKYPDSRTNRLRGLLKMGLREMERSIFPLREFDRLCGSVTAGLSIFDRIFGLG